MSGALPDRAQAVIIGGGIHGCSVAYHLAKAGWSDVILLERKQLTSGTTWHAAGLVGQLQGSHATTAFASYGVELLQEIEAETGQNPGFRQNGSISIALNDHRMDGECAQDEHPTNAAWAPHEHGQSYRQMNIELTRNANSMNTK